MNNLYTEILESIEYHTDEWVPSYVMAYGPCKAVVIWDNGERQTFEMGHTEIGGEQLPWNGYSESPDFAPSAEIEVVLIDDEPCPFSLENETNRLESMHEHW